MFHGEQWKEVTLNWIHKEDGLQNLATTLQGPPLPPAADRKTNQESFILREDVPKKAAVLLDFVQIKGGGRACPTFFNTFSYVHFWSIKGVYFLQNANNLNLKLFLLGCIYSILSSILTFKSWILISEKKLSKLGGGAGGNLDKIQKISSFFFRIPSLISSCCWNDYSSSWRCGDLNNLYISVIIDVTALSGETLEIIFNNVFE